MAEEQPQTRERRPSIRAAELWERTSSKGNLYYVGFWGGLQVLMFFDGEHPHPTREGETVRVWRLVLEERPATKRTDK